MKKDNKILTPSVMKLGLYGNTDVGLHRTGNEDNLIIGYDPISNVWGKGEYQKMEVSEKGTLLIVADGMGGAVAGEVASKIAVERIKEIFIKNGSLINSEDEIHPFLEYAILDAHSGIVDATEEDLSLEGMGTTLVVAYVTEKKCYISWVGDSRAYQFSIEEKPILKSYNSHHLQLLTPDHSPVWGMVEAGKLTAEQARVHERSNEISQYLGDRYDIPKVSHTTTVLNKGDRLMLCSDGLNGMVPDATIELILSQEKKTDEATEKLIETAKDLGGFDNITVIIADVIDGSVVSGNQNKKMAVTAQLSFDKVDTELVKEVITEEKSKGKYWIVSAVLVGIILSGMFLFNRNKSLQAIEDKMNIKKVEFEKQHNDISKSYSNLGLLPTVLSASSTNKKYHNLDSLYSTSMGFSISQFIEDTTAIAMTLSKMDSIVRILSKRKIKTEQEELQGSILLKNRNLRKTRKFLDSKKEEKVVSNPSVLQSVTQGSTIVTTPSPPPVSKNNQEKNESEEIKNPSKPKREITPVIEAKDSTRDNILSISNLDSLMNMSKDSTGNNN